MRSTELESGEYEEDNPTHRTPHPAHRTPHTAHFKSLTSSENPHLHPVHPFILDILILTLPHRATINAKKPRKTCFLDIDKGFKKCYPDLDKEELS